MKNLVKLAIASTLFGSVATYAAPVPYTIDVAFYVAPEAVQTYGKEAVHTAIAQQMALANQVYKKSGSDVTFVAKEIYTSNDGSFDSYATANGLASVSACIANLEKHAGLINYGVSGQHYYNDSVCDQVFPDQSNGINSEMGQLVQRTGADWVVVVTSDYNTTDNHAGDASGEPLGAVISMYELNNNSNSKILAHEMGHLFGLNDRYTQDASYCEGANANMLMCGGSNVDLSSSLSVFGGSQTAIDSNNLDTTDYTATTAYTYPSDFANEKMVIAKALAGMSVFYYTVNMDPATWYLQTPIPVQATATLTAGATTIQAAAGATVPYTISLVDSSGQPYTATSDVSVELYTQGGTATAGTDYNANSFIQTVTFSAGESTKTVSLPILKAGFNGTRTLSVGIRSGNGVDISSAASLASLSITDTTGSSNSGSDSGSSGGGSFDLFSMLGLLGLAAGKKLYRKK